MQGVSIDILYVDDEPDLREIVTAALEMEDGFHVRSCADAEAARAAIAARRPDLVILDVMMPHVDGPALFAALKANPATRSVPVVFMTAKVLEPELARLRGLHPAGIVQKPFDPRTLAGEIRRYCGNAPAHDTTLGDSLQPLLDDMRRRFTADAVASAARLRAGVALPPDDPASARAIAHALCGTAGTLGYGTIAAVAAAIDAAPADTPVDGEIDRLARMLLAIASSFPDKQA